MSVDPQVQILMDRIAINDLQARYFRGLDRRDFGLIASCYTPDAYVDYSGTVAEGVEQIIKTTQSVLNFHHTTVFMGNHSAEVKGDTAEGETYAIDWLRYTKDGKDYDMWGALRYYDTFIRVDGEWKISRRIQHTDWRRWDLVTAAP